MFGSRHHDIENLSFLVFTVTKALGHVIYGTNKGREKKWRIVLN